LASLVAGRDRLIVRLDASAMHADTDPLFALPGRLGLAAALRRAPRAEVILDRVPATVSRRWASLILAPAASVSVSTDAASEALRAAGVDPAKIQIVLQAPPPAIAGLVPAERGDGSFEERMRARAAAVAPVVEGAASRPLRHLPPLERPIIKTRKPGVAAIKRVQLRLFGWMFDWVIQHVNRLHHAAIESAALLEDQATAKSKS
jgi:hypothetical protein